MRFEQSLSPVTAGKRFITQKKDVVCAHILFYALGKFSEFS